MMLKIKPRRVLKPEDFKAQLWAAVTDVHGKEVSVRERIEWNQREARFDNILIETVANSVAIFDREAGGDPLLDCEADHEPIPVSPRHYVHVVFAVPWRFG